MLKKRNGFWHIDLTHPNINNSDHRIRVSTGLPAKPEFYNIAQKAFDKLYIEIATGETHNSNDSIYFSHAISIYLKYSLGNHEKNTTDVYKYAFKKLQEVLINDVKLKNITPDHIESLKLACKTRTTFNTYHRHLTVFFNYMVEKKYIKENPAKKVKRLDINKNLRRDLSPDELYKILAQSLEYKKELFNYYLILLLTGARRNEILDLTWHDIDFKRKYITLRKTKGKVDATIPLTEFMTILLTEHQNLLKPFMFKPRFVTGKFKEFIRAANLDDSLSLHCLRHTAITHLLDIGFSPAMVQTFARHQELETTMVYYHQNSDIRKESIEAMDSFVRNLALQNYEKTPKKKRNW